MPRVVTKSTLNTFTVAIAQKNNTFCKIVKYVDKLAFQMQIGTNKIEQIRQNRTAVGNAEAALMPWSLTAGPETS